jgi:ABC-type uncharacterized transport system substrate-binding protein
MRPTMRRSILTALVAATVCSAGPVAAHPHVFAEARLDVVVDADRSVSALRHLWRFDDLFSSTVLVEFDRNGDLKLGPDELEEVSSVVYDSIGEFDYFQIVSANGKPVAMKAPDRLMVNFEDNQLIILFESQPKDRLELDGTVDFGVYDPTFYTAIDFIEDAYMAVEGLPSGCERQVVRPDPDEAIAQNQSSLTEAFFNDPTGNDMSKLFATRLEISCPAQG